VAESNDKDKDWDPATCDIVPAIGIIDRMRIAWRTFMYGTSLVQWRRRRKAAEAVQILAGDQLEISETVRDSLPYRTPLLEGRVSLSNNLW
jgi:hypothetical protein